MKTITHSIEQWFAEILRRNQMSRKEKVIRVIDGDTFETASRKKPVRLANVNAPEKGQRGSAKATEALRCQGESNSTHLFVS